MVPADERAQVIGTPVHLGSCLMVMLVGEVGAFRPLHLVLLGSLLPAGHYV
jgi:hypothetical protein